METTEKTFIYEIHEYMQYDLCVQNKIRKKENVEKNKFLELVRTQNTGTEQVYGANMATAKKPPRPACL